MTTPAERTRALVQAGAFLKSLRADQSLPRPLRAEANRLLRHFPTVSDLRRMASHQVQGVESGSLTAEMIADWLRGHTLGAHDIA